MEIVKAEILWTRKCPLRCPYCAMADGRSNGLSIDQWKSGVDNLKKLGCGFAAFYGAEPLADFDKLCDVVGYTESVGIHTTVITSGIVPNFYKKVDDLHRAGAKSLSMSYDIVPPDSQTEAKTNKAIASLLYFAQKGSIRDIAAISTLTRLNYQHFIQSVVRQTRKNIWSFFDLIHQDRNQPGSKCKNYNGISDLLFHKTDINSFLEFLDDLYELKNKGFLCHTSKQFINMIKNNPNLLIDYSWNCANSKVFPSWVTVDCDGLVYPCDDYQPHNILQIPIYELFDNWSRFSKLWKKDVLANCPGCLWNTHVDANLIKEGLLPFSDYVHTEVP